MWALIRVFNGMVINIDMLLKSKHSLLLSQESKYIDEVLY